MSTSTPKPQTAVERRAAEARLRSLLTKFAPDSLRQIAAVRGKLRKRLPTAHEVVYEYRDCCVISISPSGQGYEGVFALRASADSVKLYFNQGKGLPDPTKVLQGSGGHDDVIAREACPRGVQGVVERDDDPGARPCRAVHRVEPDDFEPGRDGRRRRRR